MLGQVSSVRDVVAGTELSQDEVAGVLVLHVKDITPFDTTGGILQVGTDILGYSTFDPVALTVSLNDATTVAWSEDQAVSLVPLVSSRYAEVFMDDPEEPYQITALVPAVLMDRYPTGTRFQENMEWASVEFVNSRWTVTDLPQSQPVAQVVSRIIAGIEGGQRAEMDSSGIRFYNDAGDLVGELKGSGPSDGLGQLYVGDLSSPTLLGTNTQDMILNVDPATGSDDNDGSASFPFATLQGAVNAIPRFNKAVISILVAASSVLDEAVVVDGFFGDGTLTIDGQSSTINGTIIVSGCRHNIFVLGFTVSDDGGGDPNCTFKVQNSSYVDADLTIQSNSLKASNVRFTASQGNLHDSTLSGATSRCLAADSQTAMRCDNNIGSASGDAYRCNASIIFVTGTVPTGGLNAVSNGQIFGTGTATSGGGGTSSKRTKYYSALASASWRTTFGWRTDNDYVYQGGTTYGNHKGLWFYDDATIRSDLSGKTIDSIYIYVTRRSEGGWSSAQTLRMWRHNHHTQPGGEPTLSSGTDEGSLKWGESKWIKLPVSFAQALRDNTAKGIALYFPNPSDVWDRYVLAQGQDERGDSGKLKITYH